MSESPYSNPDTVESAAARLRAASLSGIPCDPVRDLIGDSDIDAAYAVQKLNSELRVKSGTGIVGHKIGLTSPKVQEQLGVAQPDFGLLYDDCEVMNGGHISMSKLIQPKVEAEIAFVLKKNLDRYNHSTAEVMSAIEYAVAAIEIVGSRIQNWDICITDTIADNASGSHYVLGHRPVPLKDIDVLGCKMRLLCNGEQVSQGTGAACMGSPINALVWLANTLSKVGNPLQAGQVILTGALGPMATVEAGDKLHAQIEGLGDVFLDFEN